MHPMPLYACAAAAFVAGAAAPATAFLALPSAAATAALPWRAAGGRQRHEEQRLEHGRQRAACRRAGALLYMGRANRFKSGRPESKRQARISQLLTAELASIIRQGHPVKGAKALADEVRSKISIVDVNVSPDLRNARVFVSVYGDRLEKREAYGWCVRNTGGIRFALSQRLKDMKGVPELTFQQTDIGAAVDVMHLIDQVASTEGGDGQEGGMVGGFDFDDEGDFDFVDADEDGEDDVGDAFDENSVAPY